MKLTPISIVAATGVLLLPLAAFAATYGYVNVDGAVQTESAPNATEALAIAPNIAPSSGVVVASADPAAVYPVAVDPTAIVPLGTYQYVDTSGSIQTENAPSAPAAIILPDNRAPASGVIEVTSATMIPPTVTVTNPDTQ